jgi:5-methylcytosine-specific restriction endonuclease McrA
MHEHEIPAFETWLVVHGATIIDPLKNDAVRFFHDGKTGFVTKSACGDPRPSRYAVSYVDAFAHNRPIPNGPQRNPGAPITAMEAAYQRDGADCFYCGTPLGADATCEHLLARAHGGQTHPANVALAHEDCNREAGDKSIAEKIELRDRKRHQTKESRLQRRLPAGVTAAAARATPRPNRA